VASALAIEGSLLGRHAEPISAVAFSTDGRQCVSSGLVRGTCHLWDLLTRRPIRVWQAGPIRDFALSDSGDCMIVAGPEAQPNAMCLRVLELQSGREVRRIQQLEYVGIDSVFAISNDHVLASYSDRGQSMSSNLWNFRTGDLLWKDRRPAEAIAANRRSALGGSSIWHLDTGEAVSRLPTRELVWGVGLSRDGSRAIGQYSEKARPFIWAADTQAIIRPLDDQLQWLLCAAFSPDGRFLLTGADQRRSALVLRDGRGGQTLAVLPNHRDPVTAVAFSLDSRFAASGDRAGKVFLWTLPPPR
jgi:hypothetical protein